MFDTPFLHSTTRVGMKISSQIPRNTHNRNFHRFFHHHTCHHTYKICGASRPAFGPLVNNYRQSVGGRAYGPYCVGSKYCRLIQIEKRLKRSHHVWRHQIRFLLHTSTLMGQSLGIVWVMRFAIRYTQRNIYTCILMFLSIFSPQHSQAPICAKFKTTKRCPCFDVGGDVVD